MKIDEPTWRTKYPNRVPDLRAAHQVPGQSEGKAMSEGTFENAGENIEGHLQEAAGKVTGDGELEAEGEAKQADAEGTEQDETETNADGDV
jgi:uncharacterized protein YjbJ (UPF0337 family)